MVTGIILSVVASWYLVGLTWVVGLVVYPAFPLVGANEWPDYHQSHRRRIASAVGPMWLLQAIGIVLWLFTPHHGTQILAIATAGLAASVVVITLVKAVPAHDALAHGCHPHLLRQLLGWHWLRTIIWTMCALAATGGLVQALHS